MVQNHLEERDVVIKILERGMTHYWVHEYKQMKTSYMQLKKLFEEYKKDNEILNALQTENRQLREILQKRGSKMKFKRNVKNEKSQDRRSDLISALEEVENRKKARLKVSIPYEVAEKISQFLKEKGIEESQGIPLLFQYGLSENSDKELESLKIEMKTEPAQKLWGEYAVMRFKTYEYFIKNKTMVMKLSSMLQENRALKRRLEAEGLQELIPKDEWDCWDRSIIEAYYRKYVFDHLNS
ncbi:MAG: hypothetical protein QXM93_05055 [Candidatus Methanomethyliaceae archaeon]